MRGLFTFTIGPVKPFVENSRKMADLRAGSSILSYITGEVIKRLQREPNMDIIFPVLALTGNEDSSIPNRLVAEVLSDHAFDPYQLARELEQTAGEAFGFLCDHVFQAVGILGSEAEIAHRQLRGFLETYWFFQAYEDEPYGVAYQKMVRGLNDIKRIRMFSQTTEPWGRKCTLFPMFNALFVKKGPSFPQNTNPHYCIDLTNNPKTVYQIKEKEGLSAIAFVKRMYADIKRDISSFRLMMLKERVPDNLFHLYDKGDYHDSEMANAVYDLYNEIEGCDRMYAPDTLQSAQALLKEIDENQIKLSSYFAIVKFDGDNMGDVYCQGKSAAQHKKLSADICAFAGQVKEIVTRNGGQWIYAGGEDFLGALPLNALFETILSLRVCFKAHLPGLTFSAGIIVAHLMQPMKDVLAASSELEHYAKDNPGKDAFAVGVLKRSGVFVQCRYPFGADDINMKKLTAVVQALSNKAYSRSLVFNLMTLLDQIKHTASDQRDAMVKALIQDAVRSAEVQNTGQLMDGLYALYEKSQSILTFIHTLDTLGFIAREVTTCSMP